MLTYKFNEQIRLKKCMGGLSLNEIQFGYKKIECNNDMTITMFRGEINNCKKSGIPWYISRIDKCFLTNKDSTYLVELFSSAAHNLGDDTLKILISEKSFDVLDIYKSDNNKTSKVLNQEGIMPVKIQKLNMSIDTVSDESSTYIYLDARFNRPFKFNKMIIMNYDSIKGCVKCKTDLNNKF
jgi:hypothetical protein